jgi:hypothetical protein
MNIVLVPLIGPNSGNWIAAEGVHASCLDNFFRLFLPPPASEIRAAAGVDAANAEPTEGDLPSAPDLAEMPYPNGFLVVDRDAVLLERIKKFIKGYLLSIAAVQQVNEAPVLKYFLRLLHTKRVHTVIAQESVIVQDLTSSVTEGADIAQRLVQSLRGNCDAVIAFEPDNSQFQLRSMQCGSTPYSSLFLSCHIKLQQEALQRTWHWDRDPDDHCTWLGVTPPDLEWRNERIIGATLMFESHITIADQYIGKSLCDDLIYDRYWIDHGCDENVVFQEKWGPVWLESLRFVLDAWMKSASDCGNTQARTCTVRTAADPNDWRDVLWFFIAKAERFLSKCLGGEVRFDIRAQPVRKLIKQQLHPRYIFASTRAIQSDRGFDLIDRQRKPTFRYAEITSRTIHEARHSRNVWTGSDLIAMPRRNLPDAELAWMPTMTTRLPRPTIALPGDQTDGSSAP